MSGGASGGGAPTLGFFGKLPSHGDFVRFGLSRALIAAFDAWLPEISPHPARMPDEDRFGAAALRFARGEAPGGMGDASGLVLPSADKVGRRFPLLLALEGGDADDALLAALEALGRGAVATPLARDALAGQLSALVARLR